ncbi:hypothetical protein B0H12DRAFT_1271728 [Mycena haematopus]|nr:hypothetical protein B0H12DRAFT_1271728 [Mycena haematopus]
MSSVPELRARIMELDTEINLQKELRVIKKLEHDKSLVQSQLNAVLDPIARLPFEISSGIFLHSLSGPFPEPGADHVPTLLLNICHTWSTIAISTPDLWSAIQIEFPAMRTWRNSCRFGFSERVIAPYLSRWDDDVSAVIWRHEAQLKRLAILDYDYDDNEDREREIDFFGGTTPDALPLLAHLTIRSDERAYLTDEIVKLLCLAPNLVECFLDITHPVHDDFDIIGEQLVLASLRRLTFGERDDRLDDYDDVILDHQVLSLPMDSVSSASTPLLCLTCRKTTDSSLGFDKRYNYTRLCFQVFDVEFS